MFKKKHFVFAGILAIIIVLPLISYLLVKSGADIRKNAQPSSRLDAQGVAFPSYYFISQRGDTITTDRMQGKVVVLELFSATCKDSGYKERHPLFELQEDYNAKTLRLRIISVIMDSVNTMADLNHYAERFAAREEWHVVQDTIAGSDPVLAAYEMYLQKNDIVNANSSCPENVLLLDKNGMVRGCYDILNEQQFSDLYNDVLYLIDK